MQDEKNSELDEVFAAYREATPAPEPSPDFLAQVWRRIEERRPAQWLDLIRVWSPRLAAASALTAGLLTYSTWITERAARVEAVANQTYVEALTADSLDEHDEALWTIAGNRRR